MNPSIKDVINSVPKDCYEAPLWKSNLYVVVDICFYIITIAALLMTDNSILTIALWLVASIAIARLFLLGHDLAHGTLYSSEKANRFLCRLVFLPTLHTYTTWHIGHNIIHHGFTNNREKDKAWNPVSPEEYEQYSFYQKMIHKIEWSFIGGGLYYVRNVYLTMIIGLEPPRKHKDGIKIDKILLAAFLLITFIASILWSYGIEGSQSILISGAIIWLKVVVAPWLLFSFFMGIVVYLQHVGPELSWFKTGKWKKPKGVFEGCGEIIFKSRFLNWLLHNTMVHFPHHLDARIPFYNIKKASEAISQAYPGLVVHGEVGVLDYIKITRDCKLYDYEENRWLNYNEIVDNEKLKAI